jgi:hypothetical protein
MTKLNIARVACVGALAFSPAFAQTTPADADGNGSFSIEELQAAYPDLTAEVYATLDANTDGIVDAAELTAAQESGKLVSN